MIPFFCVESSISLPVCPLLYANLLIVVPVTSLGRHGRAPPSPSPRPSVPDWCLLFSFCFRFPIYHRRRFFTPPSTSLPSFIFSAIHSACGIPSFSISCAHVPRIVRLFLAIVHFAFCFPPHGFVFFPLFSSALSPPSLCVRLFCPIPPFLYHFPFFCFGSLRLSILLPYSRPILSPSFASSL